MADPRAPTRKQLARIFGEDQRIIRAFEKLFDLIPDDITDIDVDAGQGTSGATNALALISELRDSIERLDTESVRQVSAIEALAQSVELLALSAASVTESEMDGDLSPVANLSTMAYQNAGDVAITGGAVVGQITDDSALLISSSTTLNDGAAASAGTLANAPTAGDPTKWVEIDDNGTTRYIPAW